MAYLGMDLEIVEQVGQALVARSDELHGVQQHLDRLLAEAMHHWWGTDAQQFNHDWSSVRRPQLLAASTALAHLGQSAISNAAEQRAASSAASSGGGGVSGNSTTVPPGRSGGPTPGVIDGIREAFWNPESLAGVANDTGEMLAKRWNMGTSGAGAFFGGVGEVLPAIDLLQVGLESVDQDLKSGVDGALIVPNAVIRGGEGALGGIGGGAAGGAIGTLIFPGVGTVIGSAVGGAVGVEVGKAAGDLTIKAVNTVGGAIVDFGWGAGVALGRLYSTKKFW